jgi:hypothetical protein
MHFSPHNNIYPTNFRQWYADDGLFRLLPRMGR